MIFVQRLRSSHALAVALALGACTAPSTGDPSSSASDAGVEIDIVSRIRRPPPPPPPPDASTTTPDASTPTPDASTGGDLGQSGVFTCYTEGNPGATCASPNHCCFSNYSSAHDGACTTAACTWGTQTCDGPEDCAAGQHCCAHALIDPDWGLYGYQMACQASACGAAPVNQEMCHPTSTSARGTCTTGTACVTALGNDSDLPPNLHICK